MSMLPTDNRLKYVLGGGRNFSPRPLAPFDLKVREFLALLSANIFADATAKTMPDVISFAWWCRKSNLERLAATYEDGTLRMGRGLAFHITPANMPVNFAFSWMFSLLAGNANIVRLPTRDFPQIPFIVRHIADLLREEMFEELGAMNALVTYEREEEITEALSAIADVRIVWGGDATIRSIRKAPLPARAVDVGFADRYSFCVLDAAELLQLAPAELERLAASFYNDAYIMDQNACSSPRLVVWRGSAANVEQAGERFWDALRAVVELRYELPPGSGVDKLVQACRDAIELECVSSLKHPDNRIYRLGLNAMDAGIENRRCGSGYFYEYAITCLDEIAPIVTSKYQTLTYFGLPKDELAAFVRRNRLTGIDRIVPVGKTMDIGIMWDGYDLIRTFSRACDVQ